MRADPIALTCADTGARARILPGYGFNLYSFEAVWDGPPREVLWSAPGFAEAPSGPSLSGTPILFPFGGRLRGRSFSFGGRTWEVGGLDDGQGNAIHGFVLDRPWEVVEHLPDRAVARFHASKVEPRILDWWPSDFVLTTSYQLAGGRLRCEHTVENPGDGPLPFGLAAHPYLRVPLADGSPAADCRITVPAGAWWPLAGMLPEGRTLPVAAGRDLRDGRRFADTFLDDVLGDLAVDGGRVTAHVDDPSGRRLALSFDPAFRACVVYNPPHRQAICIEPYSCVPDPFTLLRRRVDPGLRMLAPGASFRAWTELAPGTAR